ncbi:hypothetical protein QBC34DRAFT_384396 [Podospora aff. communis PSN243]|uniref:Uncharacterized protein n=1 Tax=Podospora aff. communis PSN243 TaxID=3040156 RepID=A0AAV9G970_9PEZI|nr:hypothetical protein QBC34DRAFT_384396 [Podospora aff. communis PSN243]
MTALKLSKKDTRARWAQFNELWDRHSNEHIKLKWIDQMATVCKRPPLGQHFGIRADLREYFEHRSRLSVQITVFEMDAQGELKRGFDVTNMEWTWMDNGYLFAECPPFVPGTEISAYLTLQDTDPEGDGYTYLMGFKATKAPKFMS